MRLKSCIWRPVTFVAPFPSHRTTPKAVVLHTNAIVGGPASLFTNYQARASDGKDSRHLQVAHIQIGLDGVAEQYADTDVVLGLSWDANSFSVGIETQDGQSPIQPWTDAQIAKMIEIAKELGVPARTLPESGSGGGVGYHQEYPSWNRSGHNCPGDQRRAQVQRVIDGLRPGGEDDLTDAESKKLDEAAENANALMAFVDGLGKRLVQGYKPGTSGNMGAVAGAVADLLEKAAGA